MSDVETRPIPTGDLWPAFVADVEALANRPEHAYRAILVVGMRVGDGVIRVNGGASPPLLSQTDGSLLNEAQLVKWKAVMLASATEALDRVIGTMLAAQAARASGELQ